jgi:DNA modification methylase
LAKTWEVLVGDCRALLSTLPAESVQTCVTSPPYFGLRDYQVSGQIGLEPTPEEYVAEMVGVFREVRRVLRGDGTLWLNLGDSYATQSGERTRQQSGDCNRPCAEATSLPATKRPPGLKPKDLIGIPWRVAFALQADGWYLRSDIIWAKPNPMPESVTDRPTKAHEYVFLLTKSERYYWDADAVREPNLTASNVRDKGAERYGSEARLSPNGEGRHEWNNPLGRNRRSVWTIATEPCRAAHFAVMPTKLVEPCILAGSRVGDLVLDPFAGAGTVGLPGRV